MSPFALQKLYCGYFFAIPGLAYGIFTARIPALKAMVQTDDTGIGFLLLFFGGASFLGLITSRFLIARFGAKAVIGFSSLLIAILMSIAALAFNYWQLVAFGVLGGMTSGFCEVAMNTQGMLIERNFNKLCMSTMHACFSLGGMAGSLSGSLFARLDWSPAVNFFIVFCIYFCLFPISYRGMARLESSGNSTNTNKIKHKIPFFIYMCGLVSMCCYVSEGSVGEWGSILLHQVKGAPHDQAALVFACFCISMVIFRFLGDRLREIFGDVAIVLFGGSLAAICMSIVLITDSPVICLAAYALMGIGFAPIVPILFSRAGKCPGISQAKASSTMSIMSYTGLLVFPPFLGMLGDTIGLGKALWIIVICCACIAIGGPALLSRKKCL